MPVFPVGRGVRQGCPLSPLLFALVTVPTIVALKDENGKGLVKVPVTRKGTSISALCLADDLATFVQIDRRSVANLQNFLKMLEFASGGKTNLQKSKVLQIGVRRRLPRWTHGLPFQVMDPHDCHKYLGIAISTLWNGSDNGSLLLQTVDKKAKAFSSPLLSFEARIVALKHAVYNLLASKFKSTTFKQVDNILWKYTWSANRGGRSKRPLVSWDQITLPQVWGGLGVFQCQKFQVSLLVQTVLKASRDPKVTIWAPIWASEMLGINTEYFLQDLFLHPLPLAIRGCPVSSCWSRLGKVSLICSGEDRTLVCRVLMATSSSRRSYGRGLARERPSGCGRGCVGGVGTGFADGADWGE
ncbi:hypothetical protein R1sor_008740 [Riccia sorocarpa]|uniref:Reverse transcriptase domain-containing protein n=1 Tax=Riccia sorocarpa TaxID=122646 RepID=A0ABD3I0H6_9MARC